MKLKDRARAKAERRAARRADAKARQSQPDIADETVAPALDGPTAATPPTGAAPPGADRREG